MEYRLVSTRTQKGMEELLKRTLLNPDLTMSQWAASATVVAQVRDGSHLMLPISTKQQRR